MSESNYNKSEYEEIIKSWFHYDPETDEIFWVEWVSSDWYKVKRYHNKFLKEKAGKLVEFYTHPNGYLRVRAGGHRGVYAHHITWVLTHGKMPENHIDHIDGNPRNNRIENLRDVPAKINYRNRRMYSNNTSGEAGVCWCKNKEMWLTSIKVNGKSKHIGYYKNIKDAVKARKQFVDANKQWGFTDRHGKNQ